MHVRWFGAEPWSAAVCDPDYRVEVPVGSRCLECTKPIGTNDRGIVTACSPRIWGHWQLRIGDGLYSVCSYHLSCFLAIVEGGQIEGTRIAERALGANTVPAGPINTTLPEGASQPPPQQDDDEPDLSKLEDAVRGRGWKRE